MIREMIAKVVEGENLTMAEANGVMMEIMSGETTDAQIAAFITALRMKGETVDEIAGCAQVMREKAVRIAAPEDGVVVDTCGTGGDGRHTFNISTAAALVAAGAGLKVAKHGNKSVSSSSGSADVLTELGVKIDVEPQTVETCLAEAGIGFLFAPRLHGSMKHAIGPRREVGIRTIFNILGPLTNPAGAARQVLGVYDGGLVRTLASVLRSLGAVHVLVVHGDDGLDELTTTGTSVVCELVGGELRDYTVDPADLGLAKAKVEDLTVASPAESAEAISAILDGAEGPRRDIVLLNAAAAIVAGDLAGGLADGLEKAADSIDGGNAKKCLGKLRELTTSVV